MPGCVRVWGVRLATNDQRCYGQLHFEEMPQDLRLLVRSYCFRTSATAFRAEGSGCILSRTVSNWQTGGVLLGGRFGSLPQ